MIHIYGETLNTYIIFRRGPKELKFYEKISLYFMWLKMDPREAVIAEIINELRKHEYLDKDLLSRIKIEVARRLKVHYVPKDHEIISRLDPEIRKKIRILSKPIRSLSGIVVISVFTQPSPCPGQCIYCPGGTDGPTPSPKSYSGHEPAARRAAELNYDPYLQIVHRVRQLERLGHPTDKISLIVMGGTFIALPKEYRDEFMKGVYEGILGCRYPNASLDSLKKMLETAPRRLVELTFETRPDFCFEEHVDEFLYYGATRIEIGIQSLSDDVLRFIRRGHDVECVRKAFRIAKDAGFKIVAHMMPNLPPDPNPERDFNDFLTLFEDPDFRPDMIKIYPTAVVKGTKLYDMWLHDEYEPYPEEDLIRLLARIKKLLPPWVRIQRLQRDIPTYLVEAGYSSGNLREVVKDYMAKYGWYCRCIRCREIGHKMLKDGYRPNLEQVKLIKRKYVASGGIEIFLSYEDLKNDVVVGILRLRMPSENPHRPEIDYNTAIVRELHVYGSLVPLGERRPESAQHRGFGSSLLREAELIAAEEYDAKKIVIISGIGVREYYRRFGYRLEGPYMAKNLN